MIIYFSVSVVILKRWITEFTVDKPVFVKTATFRETINNHLAVFILCTIAIALQIYPSFLPILLLGDETIHLQSGLWVYEYLDSTWQAVFQAILWLSIASLFIFRTYKDRLHKMLSRFITINVQKQLAVLLLFGFLCAYFFLLKDITYDILLIRYPPASKVIYFLTYSAFGIHQVFPRLVQLIFYVLCAVFIYRTINLFHEKNAALTGATLYLFLPISFAYGHLGELASGTIFFMAAISFYFLRYLKEGDNRDLLIAAYLIGIASAYKKLHLLMFIVCFASIIIHQIRMKKFPLFIEFKILSLSLVPIVLWMLITRSYSWRNYTFILSNLTSLDSKIITYITLMYSNMSPVIFITFLVSVIYVIFRKRNIMTFYFSLIFIVYYFFIVSDMGGLSPRFSLAFYPTIIVFSSIFIHSMVKRIKWKHAFPAFIAVLTVYLITISTVSAFHDRSFLIMNRKLLNFPSEAAMMWVKENVKGNEKVLTLRIMSSNFYQVKYGIDKEKIDNFWYEIKEINTPDKLKSYYKKNNMSYIMFPYSPRYPYSSHSMILEYLKDNKGGDFIEIAEFERDGNFIYVYELKKFN
jgi:hypothetical protein